jgi:hypothetical protein
VVVAAKAATTQGRWRRCRVNVCSQHNSFTSGRCQLFELQLLVVALALLRRACAEAAAARIFLMVTLRANQSRCFYSNKRSERAFIKNSKSPTCISANGEALRAVVIQKSLGTLHTHCAVRHTTQRARNTKKHNPLSSLS